MTKSRSKSKLAMSALLLLSATSALAASRDEIVAAAFQHAFPGAKDINSSYAAGPISFIGNVAMTFQPVLKFIGGDRVRSYEVMGSTSITEGGKKRDFVVLVKSESMYSKNVKVLITEYTHANEYGVLFEDAKPARLEEVTLKSDGTVGKVVSGAKSAY